MKKEGGYGKVGGKGERREEEGGWLETKKD